MKITTTTEEGDTTAAELIRRVRPVYTPDCRVLPSPTSRVPMPRRPPCSDPRWCRRRRGHRWKFASRRSPTTVATWTAATAPSWRSAAGSSTPVRPVERRPTCAARSVWSRRLRRVWTPRGSRAGPDPRRRSFRPRCLRRCRSTAVRLWKTDRVLITCTVKGMVEEGRGNRYPCWEKTPKKIIYKG